MIEEQFVDRHIGPSSGDQAAMLAELGFESLDALTVAAVPTTIRDGAVLDLEPASEREALAELRAIAGGNRVLTSLIGLGYHDTVTPPVIRRNVLENPAWYTAYTPYQPEISQGRLEALVNFQTMVSDLTGMEITNASMLDESTAAAEAMTLLHRTAARGAGDVFVVDPDCHPQTIEVVRTRAEPLGIEVVVTDPDAVSLPAGAFGMLVQYPGSSGRIRDLRPIIERANASGTRVAVAADLLALTLLVPPGEAGADVVVGSAQRFGVPLGFGGPHAGYLATRDELRRSLPGRLVGVSVDTEGRTAYRLTLQTREQHIRREKATSNICTAQVLLAVIAGLYGTYHGPGGLRSIASRVHGLAARLAAALTADHVEVLHDAFFDTLSVRVPGRAGTVVASALDRNINLRLIDSDTVGIALDETSTPEILGSVLQAFGGDPARLGEVAPIGELPGIPEDLVRTTTFMTHPVFSAHHSEHQMLRYLRTLSDRDLALDRTMIPLGSCTMKLNATAEMEPITWPQWAGIHPFAPLDQVAGYLRLFADLEAWLAEITGYDAVSLQPNAGSQGEYAGLLAIRAYHRSRGDIDRDVCLIPASAHGTNAASAAMAGMKVIVIACDGDGNVDLVDLKRATVEHGERLAALMVTYPSTHGVFEEKIREICSLVHEQGGQVYLDGANLNALVGVARPGKFGADVSHLNLHKTFCIPHGGGGPGVGPIGVGAHLAPFLPNHPLNEEAGPSTGIGPISAAPWGSAGILPIPWTYITMMGGTGLRRATQVAILNANYVAKRLAPFFPILYTGADGLVAHECIIDLRTITAETGVTVDDVAKRLIDFGFHAPTMSFPVAGTLMVEPTESEDRAEIDRFIEAMIAIRGEIDRVAAGEWPKGDNPLARAPHTAADVTADDWDRAYGREAAAYPVPAVRARKYWPPVSRIDGAYGDRNVFCSCPPVSTFAAVETS
ncbi:MAG: aminomethyl-transferring glycine dehydrogenase [Actinomycetota bacterium]